MTGKHCNDGSPQQLVVSQTTLQGIGLLGIYRLGHGHYPQQETLGG